MLTFHLLATAQLSIFIPTILIDGERSIYLNYKETISLNVDLQVANYPGSTLHQIGPYIGNTEAE